MKNTPFLPSLALALAAPPVFAADISPGQWEIAMESRVTGDSRWTPSPFNLVQCLGAADASDPSRLIASIAVPGATGCHYTDKSYSGANFRFALDCTGSYGLVVRGSVTFTADAFQGTMTATGNIPGGKPTEIQNKVSGKRVGGC